jgi:threonine dehydratase
MEETTTPVPFADIVEARQRIAGAVRHTRLQPSPSLSRHCSVPVALKLENRQPTGSFKLRGATNAVRSLPAPALARGLVTVSSGNHGRALAHAAREAGARCVVCLSALVPDNKVAAIRALGAEVRVIGRSQDEAQLEAERLARDEGLIFVPPFDSAAIIAGQGTIGLEIIEDCPDLATLLVPLSGGGLAAGVAAAVKAQRPAARLVGVSMERGAAMAASLRAGHPVEVEEIATLADSLGGGIGLHNQLTFRMVRDLIDDVVLLTEDEIAAGIRHAAIAEGEIVEGGGAVGIGALLANKVVPTGPPAGPIVVLISGGNIDPEQHRRVLETAAAGDKSRAPSDGRSA